MPDKKKLDEDNRHAPRTNPLKSGVRTGNPQLEPGSGKDRREEHSEEDKVRVKPGERRGS